ncbi:hypothetical protein FQN55_001707 [Onygenales sp. PD_40]|nr:hypothetical protein FQN55_001707 [Onygenales sp. PD_40]KAK2794653.1 hypothetical protein FQN51_000751 [Onygenales sp. PD_10]
MAPPTPTPTSDTQKKLEIAVGDVSDSRLRTLMIDLCDSFPDAKKWLEKELLTTEEEIPRREESESDVDEEESEESQSDVDEEEADTTKTKSADLKRLRPRYVICENCDEEFDVLDNSKESCWYHPEFSEPDYDDFFADHDENCHGPIDCDATRKEYPEGFIYPCCDRTGAEDPCEVDWHVEGSAKRRRTYY